MSRVPVRACAIAAFALAFVPLTASVASAQLPGSEGAGGAGAMGWSPLARVGSLTRAAPLLPWAAPLAFTPAPRIGLFWSGRNPSGLAWEAGDPYAEVGFWSTATDGTYRRPLDAGASTGRGATALAWQAVGPGALAGHTTFEEVTLDPGTFATTLNPYSSEPFVVVDSTRSGHRLTRARLEGAAGWRLGGLGIGAALGFDAIEGNAQLTNVPRFNKRAQPAVVVGAAHEVAEGALRVGAFARWTREAETNEVLSLTSTTVITRTNGYADPFQTTLPLGQQYYRRREADMRAAGITVAGKAGETAWAAYVEAGRVEDRQWSQRSAEAPTDTWQARALEAGAAFQQTLAGPSSVLTLAAHWNRIVGDARIADPDSIVFRATENVISGTAELRWQPAGSPWGARAAANFVYDHRDRGETFEHAVRTRIGGLSTQFAGEVVHALTRRVSLAAGYARTDYSARGSMPKAIHYPAGVRSLAGAEAAYFATPNSANAGTLGALLQATPSTGFRLTGSYQTLAAGRSGVRHELRPDGARTHWGVELAAVLR